MKKYRFSTLSLAASFLIFPQTALALDWRNIGPGGGGYFMSAAFDPGDKDIIYIGSDVAGVHKTIDGGISWSKKNTGLASGSQNADAYGVQKFLIDPSDTDTIYIGTWNGVFKSADGAESWSKVLDTGDSFGALAFDPDDSSIIFAGVGDTDTGEDGRGKVYKSTDGGAHWKLLTKRFGKRGIIYEIAVNPASPPGNRALLVVSSRGIFKSPDNGASWKRAQNGLRFKTIAAAYTLYSGTSAYIYLISRYRNKRSSRFFLSSDFGESWADITGDLPKKAPFTEIAPKRSDPSTVYAGIWRGGVSLGVYKTIDTGKHWSLVTRDSEDGSSNISFSWISRWWGKEGASFLETAPSDPDVVVWGTVHAMKSVDGGTSWNQMYSTITPAGSYQSRGLDPTYAYTVAFDPLNKNRFYVGYEDIGLFKTEDGGNSFIFSDSLKSISRNTDYDAVSSIAVDHANPTEVYISIAPSGLAPDEHYAVKKGIVARSVDYGNSWSRLKTKGLPPGAARLIIDPLSPVNDRTLYAGVYKRGLYKSVDGGSTWRAIIRGIGKKAARDIWTLAIDPKDTSVLYAGLNTFDHKRRSGLYKSLNGGINWSRLSTFPAHDVFTIVIDQNNSDNIFTGAEVKGWQTGGLYKSSDGGASWSLLLSKPYVFAAALAPDDSKTIYAASSQWWGAPTGQSGIFKSSDGGSSWSQIPGPSHLYIIYLGFNPLTPNLLYAGTHGGGLFRTVK